MEDGEEGQELLEENENEMMLIEGQLNRESLWLDPVAGEYLSEE